MEIFLSEVVFFLLSYFNCARKLSILSSLSGCWKCGSRFLSCSSCISHQRDASNLLRTVSLKRYLMMRAGTPATMAYGGTSFVTTAPAPTAAPTPMLMPLIIMALLPIQASSLMVVRGNESVFSATSWLTHAVQVAFFRRVKIGEV